MRRDSPPPQLDVSITSHHHQKITRGLSKERVQLSSVTIRSLQLASGRAGSSVAQSTLFYSEDTTVHTEQRQDIAHGIYSAKNPRAQGEDEQQQPRITSSPPQKDVKPCGLTASCKLKLLTAVQRSALFSHHWWQMVRAIIKSLFPAYNTNCMKNCALGQLTICILGKSRSLAVK